MLKEIDKMKENFADNSGLPRDIVMDIPRIILIGNNEITIENHKGINLFNEEEIKVNSKVGIISIKGRDFEILFIGGSTITISGRITSVVFEKDEQK